MFDLRACSINDVAALCAAHHGYGDSGDVATYAFAVYENEQIVAAYAWQPPAPGAARSICPMLPQGVLALSRMVAVPKTDRVLKHVSKPLRVQMKRLIDRSRWPVLVTYSDEGEGHNGYVYQCSGWAATTRKKARTYTVDGRRVSSYTRGKFRVPSGAVGGYTWIQRWEHWICEPEQIVAAFDQAWRREAIPGRVWRSGNQAYRYVRREA